MSRLYSSAVRHEVRATLQLAWPIVIAQLSFIGMSAADTMLAGRLGAEQLAAVAVGANLFFLLYIFFTGLFMAVAPVVAQALGAQRPAQEIAAFVRGAMLLALLAGVLWSALVWVAREPVLDLLRLDATTRAYADAYMRVLALAALPFCISFVQRNAADAHGQTQLSLIAGIVALLVNIVLAYGLMYGRLGLPALGPAGAGYATAAAGVAMVATYAVLFARVPVLHALRLLHPGPWPWRHAAREITRLGLPIAAILTAEASLFQIGSLIMGRFGAETLAAHQIAINFASMTFMVPLSIGIAATVRVGHAAGAGDAVAVALRGRIGIAMGFSIALVSASIMGLLPRLIAHAYTNVEAVAQIAASFLAYAAVFQIFDGVQATANGALRGIKDTRWPMLVTVAAYWVVGLPLALTLAFWTSFGPAGIWIGFIGGLVVAAGGLAARFILKTRGPLRSA